VPLDYLRAAFHFELSLRPGIGISRQRAPPGDDFGVIVGQARCCRLRRRRNRKTLRLDL
jgi:hypothetical protein